MDFIPAIDLKDEKCVRLRQGRMDDVTVFSDDPLEMAAKFYDAGARRLHIVDLDGAASGEPKQYDIISRISTEFRGLQIQVGGGIRRTKHLEFYMNAGASRMVLGTRAVLEPRFLRDSANRWPNQILLGLDVKDDKLAIAGWTETINTTPNELLEQAKDLPIAGVVFTDIARDGMLGGVGIEKTLELAKTTSLPVVTSRGISDIDDLRLLLKTAAERNIKLGGVIAGRALYEGKLDCSEAVALCAAA